MKRREFIQNAGKIGGLAVGASMLAACSEKDCGPATAGKSQETIHWKMVTTWPKNFPGLGTGANTVAESITRLSGGRIQVKVYGAGELVPAFETFDTVSRGTAQLGHCSAYYWKGKIEEAQFFSTVPFGMTAQEMNAWLYHTDAMQMWRELYAPFNLLPFPAGNTGVQMGGWFNREINSVDDLKGLKMRIPGLGGEVLKRAGGTPVNLPGGELFTALQTGALDATEWVGPFNDLSFGLHKAARYYYYPGWHEPGTTLETIVNKVAFEALPDDLQACVEAACMMANMNMETEYAAYNPGALLTLMEEHGVQPRVFPDDVIATLKQYADEVVTELAAKNEMSQKIYTSYKTFLNNSRHWRSISTDAYLKARDNLK